MLRAPADRDTLHLRLKCIQVFLCKEQDVYEQYTETTTLQYMCWLHVDVHVIFHNSIDGYTTSTPYEVFQWLY